jgi:hypothetical protein
MKCTRAAVALVATAAVLSSVSACGGSAGKAITEPTQAVSSTAASTDDAGPHVNGSGAVGPAVYPHGRMGLR